MEAIFILYVANQPLAKDFYKHVLQQNPVLDVPGMTEFRINGQTRLGIMPEAGIAKLLGEEIAHPASANGIPRSEVYLYVDNPVMYYQRAVDAGAKAISPLQQRNWDDEVAYCADIDGHIIAFANAK